MISIGAKKKARTSGGVEAAQKPTRRRIEQIARLLETVKIGTRIRYHQEYEEHAIIEGLVIGYEIEGRAVYRQSEIGFEITEQTAALILKGDSEDRSFSRIGEFNLIVPGATGEELKLDYDSRASLSRRGAFAPNSVLTVMSSVAQGSHVKFNAEVLRNRILDKGPHSGLQVAVLSVGLGTLTDHEPRSNARINTRLCVTTSKNGTEPMMTAELQDFSEDCMRLALESDSDSWPEFSKKDFLVVGIRPNLEKPLVKLQCECVAERRSERVFKITHVLREGKSEPYTRIDALELKVDLMNLDPA